MSESDETALLAADDARLSAMMRGDVGTLGAILEDELIFVHTGGRQDDKTSYLDTLRDGEMRYRSLTRHAVRARIAGDIGILTGTLTIEVTAHGVDRSADARFMTVWHRTPAGEWHMLAADLSAVKESPRRATP